jgi:hypothetical protein
MKLKNLKKKIARLEKRLREGPDKLVKLKRKLKVTEARKESAARTRAARPIAEASTQVSKKPQTVRADAKKPKRKLNLSPERRAQLAAAMKARWAAKRATDMNPKTDGDFTLQQNPRAAVVEVVGIIPSS